MLKKLKKIAFWLVFLALYLNIGWGLGYYYYNNIYTYTQGFETAPWHAKLVAGHCALFKLMLDQSSSSLTENESVFSIFWPFFLAISLISWIIHLIWWFLLVLWWVLVGLWHFLLLILWLIFAGGLFKWAFGIP